MDIKIKTNLKDIQKKIKVTEKTLLKITSEAINQTAATVVNAQRQALNQKLDRPKLATVKAVIMSQFSKPNKSQLKATVRVKDWAASYLYYIYTGDIEPARKSAYASPTNDGMDKRDKYGNIIGTRGLKPKVKPTSTSGRKGSRFIGKPKGEGSNVYGVWERTGKKGKEGLNLLVAFTPFIKHRKFIDWFKLSQKVVKNNLYKEFNKEYARRMRRTG
jgi:hypothetical protein